MNKLRLLYASSAVPIMLAIVWLTILIGQHAGALWATSVVCTGLVSVFSVVIGLLIHAAEEEP